MNQRSGNAARRKFFDVIQVSASKVFAVIADASGHGVGAVILSAMTKSGIMQELQHTERPEELLRNVNATIYRVMKKSMFVTCAAALFDNESRSVTIATSGHPPILSTVS